MNVTTEVLKSPPSYKFPKSAQGLLPWSWVEHQLEASHAYWLVTAGRTGKPHATPVWGIWIDEMLYFDGHPHTRWSRNLSVNPYATVHLESTNAVVILDGTVEDLTLPVEEGKRLVQVWNAKYGRFAPDPSGSGILRLVPEAARAWSHEDLHDGTGFRLSRSALH